MKLKLTPSDYIANEIQLPALYNAHTRELRVLLGSLDPATIPTEARILLALPTGSTYVRLGAVRVDHPPECGTKRTQFIVLASD